MALGAKAPKRPEAHQQRNREKSSKACTELYSSTRNRRKRTEASNRSTEREFPALLIVWAYQQKIILFLEEGRFFFLRVSAKIFGGIFFRLLGVFLCFLGVCFVLFGCFFAFRASARFFFVRSVFKAYHTKTGNSRSAEARARAYMCSSREEPAPRRAENSPRGSRRARPQHTETKRNRTAASLALRTDDGTRCLPAFRECSVAFAWHRTGDAGVREAAPRPRPLRVVGRLPLHVLRSSPFARQP